MRPIDRDMGDPQIVIDGSIPRIDRIKFCGRVVGCAGTLIALARLIRGGRGDQRNPAAGKRPSQWLERHLVIMRPTIGRAIAERLIIVADSLHIGDRRIMLGGKSRISVSFAHRPFASSVGRSSRRRRSTRVEQRCGATIRPINHFSTVREVDEYTRCERLMGLISPWTIDKPPY